MMATTDTLQWTPTLSVQLGAIARALAGAGTISPSHGSLTPSGMARHLDVALDMMRSMAVPRFSSPTAVTIMMPVHSGAIAEVLSAVAPAFDDLVTLEPDWDSYGADPIAPEAITRARSLVRQIVGQYSWLSPSDLTPYIMPLGDGGVQIEWAGPHGRLDVEISEDHSFNFLLMRGHGDDETFVESEGVDAAAVVEAAARIFCR